MTDQQLSAAIHGPRQATDGAPVALNRSGPCRGLSTPKTSPAEGGGLASAPTWRVSHRADRAALPLADRHYNRQKIGSPQFVPPGRCLVLLTTCERALWVTSWPFAEYVRHAWGGAWMCSCFRNEGAGRASDLIRQAVAATRHAYGEPPPLGMVTFISRRHVRPTRVRGQDVWGWTWIKAGFEPCGETKGGLLAFRLAPDVMPTAAPAKGAALGLFA